MKEMQRNHVSTMVLCSISGFLVLNTVNVWVQQPQGDYYGPHMTWNGGWWYGMFFGPILKERFARGEIDKEEYEERRRVLRE